LKAYDFDGIYERRGYNSIKWSEYAEDVLPMWIADMDFASPPELIAAIQERLEHPLLGYEKHPPELAERIVERMRRLYGWTIAQDWIVFLPGVIPGFQLAAEISAQPGEGVFVQTPVYRPILRAARSLGLESQSMELSRGADGRYEIDFDLLERSLAPNTRLLLLCNPHNPVGRVFSATELERMADAALRHDLLICSDEIHCDLLYPGARHIPIAALSDEVAARTITLMSPAKTFNMAGLNTAFAIIPDRELRQRYNRARRGLVGWPNALGYAAAVAAYDGRCDEWLSQLLAYLQANRDCTMQFVKSELSGVEMTPPEATFLAWLDLRAAALPDPRDPYQHVLNAGRLGLNDGRLFGPGGAGFLRLNFACPRPRLAEGLGRLKCALG
jgi:cysteine-S-conjugate beta-lyase